MSKTVVFDFDGVVHKYSKGWQDGTIYDEPNDNIKEVFEKLYEDGYEIVIVSTRCSQYGGIKDISEWLKKYDLDKYVNSVTANKPPALVYVDDRALKYDPMSNNLYEQIKNFKPSQEKLDTYKNMNNLAKLIILKSKNKVFEQVNKMLNEKYSPKDYPELSMKILDEWIEVIEKYL